MTVRKPALDLIETVAAAVERLSDGAPVAASVRDGVATLTGAGANQMRRNASERAVSTLPGVEDVRDNINMALP